MPTVDVMEGLEAPEEHTHLTHVSTLANALGVMEDATRRIVMIERLIVEIVHEAVPTECERLNVLYCVNMKLEVLWRVSPQQRFLD